MSVEDDEDWTDAEFDETPPPAEVQKRRGGYQGGAITAEEIEAYIKQYLEETDPNKKSRRK